MRVLLIEDDRMIGSAVQQALRDAAYAVDWVTDGEAAVHAAESETYELALLDLGLPKADGRDVLRRLRLLGRKLPVIIVTARDSVEDRIDGLDLGADDYLIKPFEMRELLARMRAVLRREASGSTALLSNGKLRLDPATREACFLGKAALLSAREFALLQALLARPGTILSRGELERQIYGWNEEVESNAIEFLIHTVRRKLGA
ncbi:MAG: response regulator transcription factor, partial [Bradyrhizobium sp.]